MSRQLGYYRYATINGDTIIFVSEDDLWQTTTRGGIARRLTAGLGECSHARLSPDGQNVAFIARDEGYSEVYVMPSDGGPATRLTYMGSTICAVDGWEKDGKSVLFVSNGKAAFFRATELFEVSKDGGMPVAADLGHVISVAVSQTGATVIGRNNNDPARWKRYKGGTAGELWIDPNGRDKFHRLIELKGNTTSPMWVGDRVYFLSDHEGVGNIYSCKPDGTDLKDHTKHDEYYVRFPSTDGKRIVYTCGADIYVLDPTSDKTTKIDVTLSSSPRHAVRRFVPALEYFEDFSIHPDGHSLAMVSRGQPFTAPFWEEAVVQHGKGSIARYRCAEWLPDGNRFVVITDADGYERLEIHHADQSEAPKYVTSDNIGRAVELVVNPKKDIVALANHRHELLLIDLKTGKVRNVDKSPANRISGLSFSADGTWLAYAFSSSPQLTHVKVAEVSSAKTHNVTRPVLQDFATAWDPEGRFLYFIGAREFHPLYDSMQFDLSFPNGMKPYLVPLRKDIKSPFRPEPKAIVEKKADQSEDEDKEKEREKPLEIDFDGIADRVVAFPVEDGRYRQIEGVSGRAAFLKWPLEPFNPGESMDDEDGNSGELIVYDYEKQQSATIADKVGYFRVGADHKTIGYVSDEGLRVIDGTAALPEDGPSEPDSDRNRHTGWIDLERVQVLIEPNAEWQQMFEETWRLQQEQFWDERMSGVDWKLVHDRYKPLLARVNSRMELSDLIWETQGELGTSHAYEMGGEHRKPPAYQRGFLGADFIYDEKSGGYRITRIIRGDSWNEQADSPLAAPGLNIKEGDIITAVGGRRATATCSIDELLINSAGKEVMLTVRGADKKTRQVAVKTLQTESWLRYRAWVEANKKYVHERTGGRIGYLHIPDMGPWGFAEFHRNYLAEIHREGLIVDARWNRGGHVSPLLLEKLARRRVGYDVSRWGMPMPYPPESVAGPIVALTNQFAGSDGDIFSHCFKLYKLGPLVGKRTWGGVIGIWPRHNLVDGTITTQPEFSFWFTDVGWQVENYGTDPDYEVDIAPQDAKAGRDPQMDKGLELIMESLKRNPFQLPSFDPRPSLPLPSKHAVGTGH